MKLSREHYRRIGEKGGRAGKWSPAKRESARRAAQIRWLSQRRMAGFVTQEQKSKSSSQ